MNYFIPADAQLEESFAKYMVRRNKAFPRAVLCIKSSVVDCEKFRNGEMNDFIPTDVQLEESFAKYMARETIRFYAPYYV